MKKSLLLALITTITFINANGQRLIPIGDNYLYGEKYVDKNQANDIMKLNPEAYRYYIKSQNQFNLAKGLGVTSIISLTSGLIMTLVSAPVAIISEKAAKTAGRGLLLMLGGCVTGTIGLVQKSSAKRNLEMSILLFNQENIEYGEAKYDIKLSIDGNGAGITYSF